MVTNWLTSGQATSINARHDIWSFRRWSRCLPVESSIPCAAANLLTGQMLVGSSWTSRAKLGHGLAVFRSIRRFSMQICGRMLYQLRPDRREALFADVTGTSSSTQAIPLSSLAASSYKGASSRLLCLFRLLLETYLPRPPIFSGVRTTVRLVAAHSPGPQ